MTCLYCVLSSFSGAAPWFPGWWVAKYVHFAVYPDCPVVAFLGSLSLSLSFSSLCSLSSLYLLASAFFFLFCIWYLHLVGCFALIHISFLLSFCFSQAVVHGHGRRGSSGSPVKTSRAPWFVSVSVLLSVSLFSTSIFSPLLFLALSRLYSSVAFQRHFGWRLSSVDCSVIQEDDTWRRGGLLCMPFEPLLDRFCPYLP